MSDKRGDALRAFMSFSEEMLGIYEERFPERDDLRNLIEQGHEALLETDKLKAALLQAAETAEAGWAVGDGASHSGGSVQKMRANLKRFET
jgi:hypothetical protein